MGWMGWNAEDVSVTVVYVCIDADTAECASTLLMLTAGEAKERTKKTRWAGKFKLIPFLFTRNPLPQQRESEVTGITYAGSADSFLGEAPGASGWGVSNG